MIGPRSMNQSAEQLLSSVGARGSERHREAPGGREGPAQLGQRRGRSAHRRRHVCAHAYTHTARTAPCTHRNCTPVHTPQHSQLYVCSTHRCTHMHTCAHTPCSHKDRFYLQARQSGWPTDSGATMKWDRKWSPVAHRDTGQGRVTGPGCWAVQLLRGPGSRPSCSSPGAEVIAPTLGGGPWREEEEASAARCCVPVPVRTEVKSKPSHAITRSHGVSRHTRSSETPPDGVGRRGWEAVSCVNGSAPLLREQQPWGLRALVRALLPRAGARLPVRSSAPGLGFSPPLGGAPPTASAWTQGRSAL